MLALVTAALVATAHAPVEDALLRAVAIEGARLELVSVELPRGCVPVGAEVPKPIDGSGPVAVRIRGDKCDWAWARVRLFAHVAVASRAIPAGAPLEGALRWEEREIVNGRRPLATLPEGAVASRAIPAGAPLEARHVREPGVAAGEKVKVVLHAGSITVEQQGTLVPCPVGTCARLASGKRVEGTLHGGVLVVEAR